MGLIRTTYFGIAAFLSAASIALLIVAIVIPYWQYTTFEYVKHKLQSSDSHEAKRWPV
jgi:hypothetical protein